MELTMKILLSPQYHDQKITYSFENETIQVTFGEIVETFDFEGLPDGKAEKITPEALPFNPIIEAERVEGVLHIKLLNYVDDDATHDELFPEWKVV